MDALDNPAPLCLNCFLEQEFRPLGGYPAAVAFADLGPHQLAAACNVKALRGGFVGLQFIFFRASLSRHSLTPLMQIPRFVVLTAELIDFMW